MLVLPHVLVDHVIANDELRRLDAFFLVVASVRGVSLLRIRRGHLLVHRIQRFTRFLDRSFCATATSSRMAAFSEPGNAMRSVSAIAGRPDMAVTGDTLPIDGEVSWLRTSMITRRVSTHWFVAMRHSLRQERNRHNKWCITMLLAQGQRAVVKWWWAPRTCCNSAMTWFLKWVPWLDTHS